MRGPQRTRWLIDIRLLRDTDRYGGKDPSKWWNAKVAKSCIEILYIYICILHPISPTVTCESSF